MDSSTFTILSANLVNENRNSKALLKKMCSDNYTEASCKDVCIKKDYQFIKSVDIFTSTYEVSELNTCTIDAVKTYQEDGLSTASFVAICVLCVSGVALFIYKTFF